MSQCFLQLDKGDRSCTWVAPRLRTVRSVQLANGLRSLIAVPPQCKNWSFGQCESEEIFETDKLDNVNFRNSPQEHNASILETRVPKKTRFSVEQTF